MHKPADANPPIQPLLGRRWSPRAFADKDVEQKDLDALFEAARWAASCFNEQPWRFIVATRDDPEAHARISGCLVGFNQMWAPAAPVLIVTLATQSFDHNGKLNRHAWHDVGLAVGNLSAEATARGLVMHQMAGIDRDAARAALGIPAELDIITALAIGHPGDIGQLPESLAAKERAPRSRKPRASLVHRGVWGG